MEYGLTRLVLGSWKFIGISEQEYAQIRKARENLLEALYLEEKFDVVVDNYLEFETDLLDSAASLMVRGVRSYTALQAERNRVNRRIINLVSAGRLYLDHSAHHLNNIFGEGISAVIEIKQEIAEQYAQSLGYRVMDALRNYVQHRGYPIYSVTYNSKLVRDSDKWLYSMTPYINATELEQDSKFKKAVLDEIKSLGDKIDIKPLLREYIEALGKIHEKVRATLQSHIKEWEQIVLDSFDRFRQADRQSDSVVGLAAVVRSDDGTYSETIQLFKGFIEYRRNLEKKNRNLVNLAKRYVTSEVIVKE